MKAKLLVVATYCVIAVLVVVGPAACTYHTAKPLGLCDTFVPSFQDTIAEIVYIYCSNPSNGDCHDGTGTQGQPDYSSFAGIQEQALNGKITEFVFVTGEMPPEFDTQGPKFLEPGDADRLRCWIDNGAPDN